MLVMISSTSFANENLNKIVAIRQAELAKLRLVVEKLAQGVGKRTFLTSHDFPPQEPCRDLTNSKSLEPASLSHDKHPLSEPICHILSIG